MKKTLIAAASVLSMASAIPAFATDAGQTTKQPAATFEQMKADYLKQFDMKISSLQQQKECIQKAIDKASLGTCWSTLSVETKIDHDDMKNQRNIGTPVPLQGR